MDLKKRYNLLLEHFGRMKINAVEAVWQYCPEKSSEFQYLPRLDENAHETASSVGEYDLQRVIGKGQFSTVMAGVRKSVGSFILRENAILRELESVGGLPPSLGEGDFSDSPRPISAARPNSPQRSQSAKGTRVRIGAAVAVKIISKDHVTNIGQVRNVESELRALVDLKG